MEWNIYKEWLDINLYRQMVSMIYQSSSREDKMNFMRKEKENDLFYGAYKQSLEEEYGLYYPDEVLERINAHRSMTKPVYRALSLALAKSDYLQEKCMFNGTQKSRFWKQFGKVLGKKDLCCISVGCLLSEKDRKSWFDELYAYPYEKVEEMVFILSVFPEDITLWQLLKGKVAACLGSRRTISVYEDWPVYAWVTGKYDKRLKNDRTKDVAVLKRLMKLSRINAENANGILIGQLEKSGYTKEEVIFLNGVLTRSESGLGQLDQESLTAEKIAVNVLKTFLPGKEPYPDAVYKLCKTLLCQYDLLPVRIDGNEKIQQCLYECLNVENVKTFLALFPFRKNGLKKWHYIDLNKKEWECLAGQLDEEAFEECVNDTLKGNVFEKQELVSYLKKYRDLTGHEYSDIFRRTGNYDLTYVFHLLCENEILDGIGLMQKFVKEHEQIVIKGSYPKEEYEALLKKWEHILFYLKCEIGNIETENSYFLLKLLVDKIGMDGVSGHLVPWQIMKKAFFLDYYEIQRENCEIYRPMLERSMHRELFLWAEEKLFTEDTEYYVRFLQVILLKESTMLWMEEEEARQIAEAVLPLMESGFQKEQLHKKYMTAEELQNYEKQKNWKSEQKKRMERWKKEKELKKSFNHIVRKNTDTDQIFKALYSYYAYGRFDGISMRAKMVLGYMRDVLKRKGKIVTDKQEIEYLMELIQKLYADGQLELDGVRKIFDRMEAA